MYSVEDFIPSPLVEVVLLESLASRIWSGNFIVFHISCLVGMFLLICTLLTTHRAGASDRLFIVTYGLAIMLW